MSISLPAERVENKSVYLNVTPTALTPFLLNWSAIRSSVDPQVLLPAGARRHLIPSNQYPTPHLIPTRWKFQRDQNNSRAIISPHFTLPFQFFPLPPLSSFSRKRQIGRRVERETLFLLRPVFVSKLGQNCNPGQLIRRQIVAARSLSISTPPPNLEPVS